MNFCRGSKCRGLCSWLWEACSALLMFFGAVNLSQTSRVESQKNRTKRAEPQQNTKNKPSISQPFVI
jgi:hypothetical protein